MIKLDSSGTEKTIRHEFDSPVKSIFCPSSSDSLFVLKENGTLSVYNESNNFKVQEKQIQQGDFQEDGFSKLRLKEYPETAEILEASIVNNTLFAKIKHLEGPRQEIKYSFELAALTSELTPDELTFKRVLNGIEACEDSKISCLEPTQNWLFAIGIESQKVVPLVSEEIDARSFFSNSRELDYPFFMFYDKFSGEVHASNFEA